MTDDRNKSIEELAKDAGHSYGTLTCKCGAEVIIMRYNPLMGRFVFLKTPLVVHKAV